MRGTRSKGAAARLAPFFHEPGLERDCSRRTLKESSMDLNMTPDASRPRRKRTTSKHEPVEPAGIDLFNYADINRRLYRDDDLADSGDDDQSHARQRALWQRLQDDGRGAWRSLIVPDDAMIARIAMLDRICPQFAPVTAWALRAATLAMASGRPLRLDPCVLLGEPGIGKTFYARRLAAAFGVATLTIQMNTVTDRGTWFTGLSPAWRAAAMGKVAQLLVDSNCASPVIVIDEVEKASPINPADTPVNVLHSLLERENASDFTDDFLEIPIRADHIIWITTANDLAPLPASIVDRLIPFEITIEPTQVLTIQRALFDEANAATGGLFKPPSDALLKDFAATSPRAMSRLWPLAFGFACVDSRRDVTRADIAGAEAILNGARGPKSRIGFLSDIAPPARSAAALVATKKAKSRE